MFDSLQSRLGGVFDRLRGRGALTERDVGLDQRGAHLAQRGIDIGFGERAAPAKLVEYAAEAGLKTFEHPLPCFVITRLVRVIHGSPA